MKIKYSLALLFAGAAVITSCKDKTTKESINPEAPENRAEAAETAKELVADPAKSSVTVEQRAAKLGFAKHLPKNIVVYDGMFNGRKAMDQFLKTPLGAFVLERLEDEGMSLDDLNNNGEIAAQIASYSEEYFTAFGPGAGDTFELGLEFTERFGYYISRYGVFYASQMLLDNKNAVEDPKLIFDGPLKGVPADVIKMIAEFDMPAYYQGSKVSDKEARGLVRDEVESAISMLGSTGAAEEFTLKRAGVDFTGYKLSGAKLAELIDEDDEKEMQEVLNIKDIREFKKTLATKNIVAAVGEIGDYVITFFGKSVDDLVIVEDVNDSICASDHIVFLDDYLEKDLLLVGLRDKSAVKDIEPALHRVISSMAQGLSDGLKSADSLGDTQDVEAILESLSEQGRGIAGMFDGEDAGWVSYLEEGLKFESFGGSNIPSLDFGSTHTLAPMAAGEGTLLFANWTSNPDYNERIMEYVDTLGESGYLITKRLSALGSSNEGVTMSHFFSMWMTGPKLFDEMFRDDTLEIWMALRGDMAQGLGSESALVIDINGSLPKVPNVPDVILKEGKMPRVAYVSTVDDRKKLQKSWKRLNTSLENLLKNASEISGMEIPMQVPMSSEKNDLKTWFIPIPFQNDDFVPSVSVSDDLFFVSSSKTFSEGLDGHAKKGGGEARNGAWVHVDFKVLNQYLEQWMNMIDKNIDKMDLPKSVSEDFKANKPMLQKAMASFGLLDDLTIHIRQEDDRTRMSLHLKAK